MITLTEVEAFLKRYPEVYGVYCHNRDELLGIGDTGSNEFQILVEINFTFWRMAEEYIKLGNDKK